MNDAKRAEIFARLKEANPEPTTELNYSTPLSFWSQLPSQPRPPTGGKQGHGETVQGGEHARGNS